MSSFLRYNKLFEPLFNGISTFMDYLMPKPSLKKYSDDIIQPITGRDKGVHAFPLGISQKVNIIA